MADQLLAGPFHEQPTTDRSLYIVPCVKESLSLAHLIGKIHIATILIVWAWQISF